MTSSPSRWWWSTVAAAVALASPGVVRAQSRVPRVAVGPFSGERAAVTRSMIAGVFANHAGEIELASQSEYNGAAARLGVGERPDEGSISTVAQEIRADNVVVGSLDRQGTGFRLRLRVLRGRDGRSAGSASWEFERIEELNALANEIWEQLHTSFQVDPATRRGSDAPQGPTRTEPSARAEPVVEAPAATTTGDAPTPGLGWFWIQLGGGIAGRTWRVPLLGETTPRGYENGAFGELRGTLAAHYRLNQNRLGVGVEASLGLPVGLSSQGRGADGRAVPIATSSLEFQIGASLVMRPMNGGMMRAFVGMMYHDFSLDTVRLSPEMRLAPVTYVGLRVAGEGILPVVARREFEFGIIFGGELRLAAVGSEMKEAFGVNPDTTFAYGSWFGLNFRADKAAPGLAFRLTAEFLRYATDFAGPARVGSAAESVDDYTHYSLAVVYALGTDRAPRRPAPDDPASAAAVTAEPEQGARTGSGDPFGGR